jgi:hypothetical protein
LSTLEAFRDTRVCLVHTIAFTRCSLVSFFIIFVPNPISLLPVCGLKTVCQFGSGYLYLGDTYVNATSPAAKLVLMLNVEASIDIYLNEEEIKQFIQTIYGQNS